MVIDCFQFISLSENRLKRLDSSKRVVLASYSRYKTRVNKLSDSRMTGGVDTLLKEYKVYIKYVVLFGAAYLVKCVFEFLYNRSAGQNSQTQQVLRCKQTM